MRKQAALLSRQPLIRWIKKTPQEVLLVGSLMLFYLIHNLIVLFQMLIEMY